jgi:DNA primase
MASGSAAIEEIKERLSIVDVVSTKVQLKKAGRTLKGLCPFHSEKTPSFIVFPDKGDYHCFGCQQHGDIFTFVMKTENLDFPAALERLAQQAGVTIRPRQEAAREDKRRARIFELNALAADYYHQLLRRDVGKVAWAYLVRRGISLETAEAYGLGWAPDSYDALLKYLVSRGASEPELLEAGLIVEREDRRPRDTFRARVTFPIRDDKGNTLGFGGRTLADIQPKYLNTPGTPVFDKGACLYGLDSARQAIRQTGHAVVVESSRGTWTS